jgi:hypothetical protein
MKPQKTILSNALDSGPYNVGLCGVRFLHAIFTMPFRRSLNHTYITPQAN